ASPSPPSAALTRARRLLIQQRSCPDRLRWKAESCVNSCQCCIPCREVEGLGIWPNRATFPKQHAVLDVNVDVALLDAGHLKEDLKGIAVLVNIRGRQEGPDRNRAFLFSVLFAFLLHLQFLRAHDVAP